MFSKSLDSKITYIRITNANKVKNEKKNKEITDAKGRGESIRN